MNNISNIRKSMKKHGIDYYLIPSSDPHKSEYVAEYYRGRSFASGFTGSAGTLLISNDDARLWTDGRYFIQAEKQIENSGIKLMKMGIPGFDTILEYIQKEVKEGETIGFYGRCYSSSEYKDFKNISESNKFNIKTDIDILDEVWDDRPSLPDDKVFLLDEKFAGKSASEKISEVRAEMKDKDCDTYLISSLDDIAWLYNIRGNDVKFTPVVMSFALISEKEAILYIDNNKITDEVSEKLTREGIIIKEYGDIYRDVAEVKGKILIDPNKVNCELYNRIINAEIVEGKDITTSLKSIKNDIELDNFENCQIKDGVAMVKFIKYLKDNIGYNKITEMSASEKLSQLRAEGDLSKGDSFNTIAAYKDHAAMMHYSATKESDVELKAEGLFLVDSGGQYFDGTTDITRTIVLGDITEEEKRDFTLVLKSHIALAEAKFLKGTCGANLDILARKPMWDNGLDYKCGTGHGVGFMLSVHEGPQNISQKMINETLKLGMNITNEPGVYKEGKHGIRTENIMIVTKYKETDCGEFYQFKTVTYCPIDLEGIDSSILTEDEVRWINDYHDMVYEKLSLHLSEDEKEFLKEQTKHI